MNPEKMKQEALELVQKHDIEAAREFLGGVENEGLVYYITNFGTPFDDDEIFKKGLKLPFFEAIDFLQNILEKCEIKLDEQREP